MNISLDLALFLIIKEYISYLKIKLSTLVNSSVTQRVKRDIILANIFIKKINNL